MKKLILAVSSVLVSLSFLFVVPAFAASGFDQYGYNDTARNFVGTGNSWCLAGGYGENCLGIYSSDKLIMKWNKAWDDCNANGYDDPIYCLGAWTDNEWNGMNNGSDSVWHYKIIWVGSLGESSPYWLPGGYLVWGNYEVVMDQGTDSTGHWWYALATPNGYGAVFAH